MLFCCTIVTARGNVIVLSMKRCLVYIHKGWFVLAFLVYIVGRWSFGYGGGQQCSVGRNVQCHSVGNLWMLILFTILICIPLMMTAWFWFVVLPCLTCITHHCIATTHCPFLYSTNQKWTAALLKLLDAMRTPEYASKETVSCCRAWAAAGA